MTDKTVKDLAKISNKDVSLLQKQLQEAGMPNRGENDLVSEAEQEKLLAYLQKSHGQTQKKPH